MVVANDIKVDSISTNPYIRPAPITGQKSPNETLVVEEVQQSRKIDNLVQQLAEDAGNGEASINDARVDQMIAALKNGTYQVNYNKLAHNLIVELINTSRLPGGANHGDDSRSS